MSDFSFIYNAHPSFIDNLYKKFKTDPSSIEDSWRLFFEGFEFGGNNNETANFEVASASGKINTDFGE